MDCIDVLLDKGADANIKTLKGQTAADLAKQLRPRLRAAVIAKLNGEEPDVSSSRVTLPNASAAPPSESLLHMNELARQRLFSGLMEGVGKDVRRMLALSELWGLIKYSHPYLAYRLVKWDEYLMEAAEIASNPSSTNKQFLSAVIKLVNKLGDPNTRVLYGNKLLTPELLEADSIDATKPSSVQQPSASPLAASNASLASSSSAPLVISIPVNSTTTAAATYPIITLSDDKCALVDFTNYDNFNGVTLAALVQTFASIDASSQGIVFDCRCLSSNKPSANFGIFFQEAFRALINDPIVLPLMRQRMYQGLPEHVKLSNAGPTLFEHGFVVSEATLLQPLTAPIGPTKRRPMSFIVDKNTPLEVINIAIALQSRAQAGIIIQAEKEDVMQTAGSENRLVWEPGLLTTDFKLSDLVEGTNRPANYSDIVVQIRQNERFNPDGSVGLRADQLVVVSSGSLSSNPGKVLDIHPASQHSTTTKDSATGLYSLQSRFKLNVKSDIAVELGLLFCYGKTARSEGIRQLPFPIKSPELEWKENELPKRSARFLALFRIWNAVRFFYPYKSLLQFPWEFAFVKTYNGFANAESPVQYSLAIAELVALLSDAHAYVRSPHLGYLVGTHVPSIRVKQVGDATVVTHVAALSAGNDGSHSPRLPPLVAVPTTASGHVHAHSHTHSHSHSSSSGGSSSNSPATADATLTRNPSQHIVVRHASSNAHHAVEKLGEPKKGDAPAPVSLGVQIGDIIVAVDGAPVQERRDHLAGLFSLSSAQAKKWRTDMKLLAGPEGSLAKLTIKRPITRVLDAQQASAATSPKQQGEALPTKPATETQYAEFIMEVPRNVASQVTVSRAGPVVSILESRDKNDKSIAYLDMTRLAVPDVDTALAQILAPANNVGAVVFDIRGHTRGTIFRLAPHFASHVTHVASTEVSLMLPSLLVGDIQSGMQLRGQQRCVPSHPVTSGAPSPSQALSQSLKLVALVNEETMSHGEYAATVFKAIRPDTIFFGTPTTGSVGSVTNLPVPGGILVGFTAMGILKSDGTHIQTKGITPDHMVLEKPESILTGKDDIMEAALAFLKTS